MILVPLCTWLYLLTLLIQLALSLSGKSIKPRGGPARVDTDNHKSFADINVTHLPSLWRPWKDRSKVYVAGLVLYYLLLIAQFLMCLLEVVRLSLAHLGVGLLPFTFVALIAAGSMRATLGMRGKVAMWRGLTLVLWLALAVTNSIKIAGEVKEGTDARKGSKYPVVDQLTDLSVMVGVYVMLAAIEAFLKP